MVWSHTGHAITSQYYPRISMELTWGIFECSRNLTLHPHTSWRQDTTPDWHPASIHCWVDRGQRLKETAIHLHCIRESNPGPIGCEASILTTALWNMCVPSVYRKSPLFIVSLSLARYWGSKVKNYLYFLKQWHLLTLHIFVLLDILL